MTVFYKVINGFKVKFCRTYFCIGIGMDQFTPVYHRYITGQSLGPVKNKTNIHLPKEKDVQPQSKSLAKTNYGKRARHKN
jgi:hypothetical protein